MFGYSKITNQVFALINKPYGTAKIEVDTKIYAFKPILCNLE
jgi:hypothetical protein